MLRVYTAFMFTRAALLILLLCVAPPAFAGGCLNDRDARQAVAQGGLIPMRAMIRVATEAGGELISAKLCEGGGGLVYRVVVLQANGVVTRLVVDANTGDIMGGQ